VEKTGQVALPRVKTEYAADLKPTLTDLGMGIAFDPNQADFSGIRDTTQENLYIKFVRHKTYLAIDEEGTEAAAATSVGVGTTSAPVLDFTLRFERPFFFAIRDDKTGTLLFLGAIKDPS
jgi:serpin B